MPTIDEQLAALAATWEEQRRPITPDEATERSYVVLDAPRLPVAPARRRTLLAVAAVFVLLVGAGAWAVARSDGRQVPAAADDSPFWLPPEAPSGWQLVKPVVDGPALAFGSSVTGERAIFVEVDWGDVSFEGFSDPVEVGGHRGRIRTLSPGRLLLMIDLGRTVSIHSIGVTEQELLAVAASYRPGVAWTDVPITLPADFPPPTFARPNSTDLRYAVTGQFQATLTMNPEPAAELARLATLVGPLQPLDGGDVLVGRAVQWHGMSAVTGLYRPVAAGVITVVSEGDNGSITGELLQLARSVRPATEDAYRKVAATGRTEFVGLGWPTCSPERERPDSPTVATVGLGPSSVDIRVVAVPPLPGSAVPGTVVCASLPPIVGLGPVDLPTDVLGTYREIDTDSVHGFVGLAPPAATTVRVEAPDGSVRATEVVPVPGTNRGLWALPRVIGDRIRSIEFIDPGGTVVLRAGRPAR